MARQCVLVLISSALGAARAQLRALFMHSGAGGGWAPIARYAGGLLSLEFAVAELVRGWQA